ncbi:MAG TPA: ABC transporter permease [Haliangiales bacterium]|nr:ABC transporter permease [Haliangiales bacterium]
MRQFLTIARNAFMELVRQPVFLLLMTCSAVFNVFLAAVPYFGFGDDPKLVKDSTLAVMLLSGLFGAVLNASASVAHEIRSGTALAVLAKPVGRAQFLLAKYLGLAAALTVLTYVNALAALLASRMAYDAYGDADMRSFGIFCGLLALGYAAAGFINYFLRRPFVANAVLAVVVMATLAFVVILCFTQTRNRYGMTPNEVDWRLAPAAILILFALWVLAGLALACSTRFEMIPTLAICTGVFLLGLMSDYLFGRRAEPVWTSSLQTELNNPQLTGDQKKLLQTVVEKYDRNQDGLLDPAEQKALSAGDKQQLRQAGLGGRWWASVLYTVVPNWQLFWLADVLEAKNQIPWSYVGRAFGYVIGYLGASLALGLLLFEDRELS